MTRSERSRSLEKRSKDARLSSGGNGPNSSRLVVVKGPARGQHNPLYDARLVLFLPPVVGAYYETSQPPEPALWPSKWRWRRRRQRPPREGGEGGFSSVVQRRDFFAQGQKIVGKGESP